MDAKGLSLGVCMDSEKLCSEFGPKLRLCAQSLYRFLIVFALGLHCCSGTDALTLCSESD